VPEPERPSLTLPAELIRRAESLLDGGQWRARPARDAATVVLLREHGGGVEVLVQRRPGSMAFAPGMHVFPGGGVEASDADGGIPWRGPPDYEPFSVPPAAGPTASFRALTVAGVRETWEEAGVALVAAGSGAVLPEPGESLIEWLAGAGAQIAGDRLFPWVHWITPEVEERRFDTRFLVAALPEGAHARDFGVETDRSRWVTPGRALDLAAAGAMPMLPPTADALQQLAEYASIAAVVAAAPPRRPRPHLPRPYRDAGGRIAWQIVDGYTGEVIVP
jgi:8-oxo-dGTP pyrophosphatase MutT (NUDIX family)